MSFILVFVLKGVSWFWGVEGLARVTVKDMSPGLQRRAELTHQPAQVCPRRQTGGEVPSLPEQFMFAELTMLQVPCTIR